MGFLVPWPGIELTPQWKLGRVITTGLPGGPQAGRFMNPDTETKPQLWFPPAIRVGKTTEPVIQWPGMYASLYVYNSQDYNSIAFNEKWFSGKTMPLNGKTIFLALLFSNLNKRYPASVSPNLWNMGLLIALPAQLNTGQCARPYQREDR